MTNMKDLKKKINKVKTLLQYLLPISGRMFYYQNMAIFEILQSHKEFQMLNRQDIMTLAALMTKQQKQPDDKLPIEPKSLDDEDVMYG